MVKTYNCLYSISIITVAINLYCANVLNVDSAKISRRLTEAPVRQDTTKEQSHANTPTTISIPRRRSREFLTQNPPWRFHRILPGSSSARAPPRGRPWGRGWYDASPTIPSYFKMTGGSGK